MIVPCVFAYDTELNRFENASTDADVLVYVNADLNDSGSSIVTAIRSQDRRNFNWILSDQTTLAGIADIAGHNARARAAS